MNEGVGWRTGAQVSLLAPQRAGPGWIQTGGNDSHSYLESQCDAARRVSGSGGRLNNQGGLSGLRIRPGLGLERGVAGQDGDALAVLEAFDAADYHDIAGADRAVDGD